MIVFVRKKITAPENRQINNMPSHTKSYKNGQSPDSQSQSTEARQPKQSTQQQSNWVLKFKNRKKGCPSENNIKNDKKYSFLYKKKIIKNNT